jgi:hypothetical protein
MAHRLYLALLTSMLFVALGCCCERQALAYVDPGSTLLLFQSLSAMVSGAVFYFRRRIRGLFTKTTPNKTTPESDEPVESREPGPR